VPPAVTGRAFREMNALYFETTARRGGIGTGTGATATAQPCGGVTRTLSAVRDRSNMSERSTSTAKGDGTATISRSSANR
jgi:hypothetical protein